jgi:methylenetetrahydrofolate dehydrogenase (NADP+)/methenyltetrahydrofolate cyclohydrolase
MGATRLDGKACAADLEERLKSRISECSVQPHLAVIIVGDDPASHVYVNNKVRSCGRLGIKSTHIELPTDTEQDVVAQHILDLNQQDDLHGILIQSPLPKHMDEEMLTELIDPRKDVDGFHPVNLGRLVQGRSDGMVPCTPSGVMEMLSWANVDLTGKKAVVLGRSFNVGMPQALLMAAKGADATVTIVHSRTRDAQAECLIGLSPVLSLLMLELTESTMLQEIVAGGLQAMFTQMLQRLHLSFLQYLVA